MAKNQTTPRKGSKPIGEKGSVTTGNRRLLWIVIGAAAGLIIILALVALLSNRGNGTTLASETGMTVAEAVGQPVDRRIIGDPNAPVLIEAFEDFQCPHCQRFTADMEDTILNDLVAPGIARFSYMHRFVIGEDSIMAGAAAECAADQGLFWEYHDVLYTTIPNNAGIVQPTGLKSLADDVPGLDKGSFDRCVDTREHYEKMLREDNESRNRGVNSTPTVFINGVHYQGDFNPEQFTAAVQAAADAS